MLSSMTSLSDIPIDIDSPTTNNNNTNNLSPIQPATHQYTNTTNSHTPMLVYDIPIDEDTPPTSNININNNAFNHYPPPGYVIENVNYNPHSNINFNDSNNNYNNNTTFNNIPPTTAPSSNHNTNNTNINNTNNGEDVVEKPSFLPILSWNVIVRGIIYFL